MNMRLCCFMVAAALPCACLGAHEQRAAVKGGGEMKLSLTSEAFQEGGMIPKKYTCDGPDVSPPLAWSPVPAGTKSIALICDDPDAPMGTWVHWVAYNLPPDSTGLAEGVRPTEIVDGGGSQGLNDFRRIGYGGPCPPRGTHRYFFKLYALDVKLDLGGRVTKERLLKGIGGHILSEAQLMGKYTR